jgi:transcriptional regulator of acetoin/glycerol metabolism
VIRRAIALADGQPLDTSHLPDVIRAALDRYGERVGSQSIPPPAPSTLDAIPLAARSTGPSREDLVALLERHGGNLASVARAVGKDRSQVHRWLRKYEIDPDRFRR